MASYIFDLRKPLAENYYPDVWTKHSNGKIDVYEVFHSDTIEQAVVDSFFTALVEKHTYFAHSLHRIQFNL